MACVARTVHVVGYGPVVFVLAVLGLEYYAYVISILRTRACPPCALACVARTDAGPQPSWLHLRVLAARVRVPSTRCTQTPA
jgi:hypothetical protein